MSRRSDVSCKVYVGDLPRDATEKELERAFGYYGSLKSVWVAQNPAGFAFIEFDDERDAEDAVKAMDGTTVCGSRVRVEHSTGRVRSKPWMRGGGGGGRGRGGGGRFDPEDRCYECGERGHYAYDCQRSRHGGGSGGGGGGSRRARSRSRSPRRRSYSRSRSH